MPGDLQDELNAFTKERKFNRKGPLCVALVLTQQARAKGLPLDSAKLLTEGGGAAQSAPFGGPGRSGRDRSLLLGFTCPSGSPTSIA